MNTHHENLAVADMSTKGDSKQLNKKKVQLNKHSSIHSTEFQLCARIVVLVWSTEVWDVNMKTHTWAHRNTQRQLIILLGFLLEEVKSVHTLLIFTF